MNSIRLSFVARIILLLAACALWTAARSPARAADCTLADHIESANTNSAVGFCPKGTSHDIITISENITLSETLPTIRGTITIEGGGHTISGAGQVLIFDVQEGGRLTIKQLTLTNGNGGSLSGGAIRVQRGGRLRVENVTFRNNSAHAGGAIGSVGQNNSIEIVNSHFAGNFAKHGGAVTILSGEASIDSSSFRQNLATVSGGAIRIFAGDVSITNSTLVSNIAPLGGGVHASGGIVTLAHLTMIDNSVSGPEGASLSMEGPSGQLNLRNSIIAGNSAESLCAAHLIENVGNLIEDRSCDPEYSGDPMLELAGDLAGHLAPRDGSPAINAAFQPFCTERDQAGTARPYGPGCDIGAIESTSAGAANAAPLARVCTLSDHILSANTNTAVGGCQAGTNHDSITIGEDIKLRLPLPPITGTITIEGGGHTISGRDSFRIFLVNGGNLTVNNLTLADGYTDEGGGAIHVRNGGWVTVNDSTFIGNYAGLGGGAIDLRGATRRVSANPRVHGTGVYSYGSAMTVNNSSFIGNNSERDGGALTFFGRSAISNSSFIDNSAGGWGGAIFGQNLNGEITNSTFSGNQGIHGGVYLSSGTISLTHLTLVGNSPAININRAQVYLRNSIIAGRGSAPLCSGRLYGNIANFIADGSCLATKSGNALLGGLTGSPAHHPPLDGSPALDSADPRYCPDTDQLGTARPLGEGCDLGAIESTTALPAPDPLLPPPPCPLDLKITAANTDAPAGGCPAGSGHDVITLTEDIELDAVLPPITSQITIEGNGYTISGAETFRIFDVDGGQLTLADMTLRDGDAARGGAIRLINGARVQASKVTFHDNFASQGGAIATESSNVRLDVSQSSFIRNIGESRAGAVLVAGGVVNISGSAFVDNGEAWSAAFGGAMETRSGTVTISNSTFSANMGREGGAIYNSGADTTLTHVTLMNNRADNFLGAGIYHRSGTLRLRNSIVAGSGRGDDCSGTLNEARGSLSQDGTCGTSITGDPLLAALTGAVAHYPLLDASPAHGTGDPAYCLPSDQLGNSRPNCDIGAIEWERVGNAHPPPARVIPAACTLADQIIAANTDAPAGACPAGKGADIITLRGDIRLSEALPTISSDLTIRGHGHTINGDNRLRIFDIEHGEVNIKDMTLINGSSPGGYGGAILARGDADVVVAQVTFRNNRAGWGAGIASLDEARLQVLDSGFFDNSAEEKGGAIWFSSRECYRMSNPLLVDNSSSTEILDPRFEIFAPHLEFRPGAADQCST